MHFDIRVSEINILSAKDGGGDFNRKMAVFGGNPMTFHTFQGLRAKGF